ncbi:phospholipid-translocating P-type ATPase protein [Rutstroemia sp. NJR-2017a BVV2]|nr:phospholipid-translocating P-type ATPase protein [Rutstroemia sp. NJR-2017a BVV2]
MSSSGAYHQPNPPDSPVDDPDSDLELDLQELDSITTSDSKPHNSSSRNHQNTREERRGPHIPLRNLRMGGLRNIGRNRGYGDLGRNRDADNDEDQQGLLNDDQGGDGMARTSGGSSNAADDDAPLLSGDGSGGSSSRRRRRSSFNKVTNVGSQLRLPSFLSGNKNTTQPVEDDGDEQEEDHDPASSRTVAVGATQTSRFPPNAVSNAKYTPISFLPRTLYNEFSFFFNMYFLLVALSQAIPPLRIGYLSTYIVPLVFVLAITLGKEAFDDIARRRRDAEANSEGYTVLCFDKPSASDAARYRAKKNLKSKGTSKKRRSLVEPDRLSDILEEEESAESHGRDAPTSTVREVIRKSRDLKVGDVLKLGKDQRVPADVVILKSTSNDSASAVSPEPVVTPSAVATESLLVDTVSDPPIDMSSSTNTEAHQSTSELGNTPSADASGAGETFIRTDQLDGETDWKLRLGSPLTQSLETSEFVRLRVVAGKPDKKVNEFIGTVELLPKGTTGYDPHVPKGKGKAVAPDEEHGGESAPLTIDNTAWANTVLASNATTLAVIVYTGPQTRSSLSTSPSRSKTGLLEFEINSLTKILCALTLTLSIVLVALEGFEHVEGVKWYVKIMRFLVLFSTIVPISLRVNLDMGKSVYSWFIQKDPGIEGAVVRTSTIPEELGRIEYLLSDKTGTLTQNEMEMKKIHVGTVSYANEAMDEVATYVRQGFSIPASTDGNHSATLVTPSSVALTTTTATRTRREIGSRVRDVVLALALCHNVTPTVEEENGHNITSYQASSPDEIAIVKWTEAVGLRLVHRDRKGMLLQSVDTGRSVVRVRILEVFPFTSEGKRMGIIVQFMDGTETTSTKLDAGEIWFYQKGADTVMTSIVASNDWLDEETANMAREGLRTLVVGRKRLSVQNYQDFTSSYKEASVSINNRDAGMARVVSHYLEKDLELLGVTGVEDKLQRDVKPSLELLRNAGIKIWMLTGDKVETARCVAVSAKLVALWHGRNSYKRSAKLAQFVIHRGLIISVCQTMYSIAIKFEPEGLYKDWLLVGYATVYTMAPVFSLVLDKDVDENLANLYPELYKELTSGSSLSYRTFFVWVFVSIYQGGMIQGLSQLLTEVDSPRMVAVSFTVLVLNELTMVAFEITTWHPIMIISLIGTLVLYLGSIPFLGGYFDLAFIVTWGFVWRVAAISAVSLIPPYAGKLIRRTIKPPSYRKVQGI